MSFTIGCKKKEIDAQGNLIEEPDPCAELFVDFCADLESQITCSSTYYQTALEALDSTCNFLPESKPVILGMLLESCQYDSLGICSELAYYESSDIFDFGVPNIPISMSITTNLTSDYRFKLFCDDCDFQEVYSPLLGSSGIQATVIADAQIYQGALLWCEVSRLNNGTFEWVHEESITFRYDRPPEWLTTRQIQLDTLSNGGYSLEFYWWGM